MLLVGEDDSLTKEAEVALRLKGYEVLRARGKPEILSSLSQQSPDLIILRSDAPAAVDPWEACGLIREESNVLLLVIVAEKEHGDMLKALRLGADDCIVQPVPLMVLLARIDALLRRVKRQRSEGGPSHQ